jgi:C4-type Zn-finger protein
MSILLEKTIGGRCPECGAELDYDESPTGYYSEDGFVDTGWTESDICFSCGYRNTKVFSSRNEDGL